MFRRFAKVSFKVKALCCAAMVTAVALAVTVVGHSPQAAQLDASGLPAATSTAVVTTSPTSIVTSTTAAPSSNAATTTTSATATMQPETPSRRTASAPV